MRFFYLALLLLTTQLLRLPFTESCEHCSDSTELLNISFDCVNNSFGIVYWTLTDSVKTDGVFIHMECIENKTFVYELPVASSDSLVSQSRSVQYSRTISSGTNCSIIGCVETRFSTCRVAANTVCTHTPTSSGGGSEITVTSNEITDYFTMTTTLDHSSTALVSSTGELSYSLFSSIRETSQQPMTTHDTSHPSSTSSIITQSSISQSSFQSLNSQSSHTQSSAPTQSISDPPIDNTALLTIIIGSVLIPVIGTIVCCIVVFVYIVVWRNSKRRNESPDFSQIFEMELYKLDDVGLGSVVTIFQPLQNCTLLSEKVNTMNNKDTESNDSNNVKEFFSSIKTDSTLKALESNKPVDINDYELPQESNKLAKSTNSNGQNSSLTPVQTAAVTASSCDTSGYVTVAHMLNTQPHNRESEFMDTSSDSMEYNDNEFSDKINQTSSGIKFDSSAVSDYVHM